MSYPESPETRQKIPASPNVKVLEKIRVREIYRNHLMDLSELLSCRQWRFIYRNVCEQTPARRRTVWNSAYVNNHDA